MPSESRAVEVSLPEAERLADLYGIAHDIRTGAELCAKAVEMGAVPKADSLVVEALVTPALIRYCRCFSGGVRLGISRADIEKLDVAVLAAHDYFRALRDKFVAHSVNPFEDSWVTATARVVDGAKQPIRSIGPGLHRMLLSDGDARYLAYLLEEVGKQVAALVRSEEQRLLAHIETLPLEFLHNADLRSPIRINVADVAKARAQARPNKSLERTREE